jgi:hypothetical protein
MVAHHVPYVSDTTIHSAFHVPLIRSYGLFVTNHDTGVVILAENSVANVKNCPLATSPENSQFVHDNVPVNTEYHETIFASSLINIYNHEFSAGNFAFTTTDQLSGTIKLIGIAAPDFATLNVRHNTAN